MTTSTTRHKARRRTARKYLPPQHGAWAMLLVPWLTGVLTAGFRWPHLPLLGAWLSGYLLSYYALQALKTRRLSRVRPQLLLYGPLTAVLALVVVIARPQVLFYTCAYAPLLAFNAYYARQRHERALLNDLTSVLQSCLVVFVAATVAGTGISEVGPAFTTVMLYFTGTVLYVKTMIRERGNPSYHRASIAYHVLALGVASLLTIPIAAVFLLLLIRATILPRYRLTPKHVGIAEIIASVLVLLSAVLA
ncbi:YwiC-like family protein [Paractinoplanes hotanensis]|uniref:YwiC-like family protein n=1 Tax=Paractinoplanes hotanensis TaxID=2906497 RepID=A0ABT0YF42_9ACTN|nr:YwiC-like family protein [Actinoplanes hotanensis]MCM4084669.1 YwiC-like family protein [Actinoplanes hotanensis]